MLHTFLSPKYIWVTVSPLSYTEQLEWIKKKKSSKAETFLFGSFQIAGEKQKVEHIIITSKLARKIPDSWQC